MAGVLHRTGLVPPTESGFSTEDRVLHTPFHIPDPELSTGVSTVGIITRV